MFRSSLFRSSFVCIAVLLVCSLTARAEPYFVDLSDVANAGLETDSEGHGGWIDEGVNDMGIYPPVVYGESVRNGYHFSILDPAKSHGNSVLVLRGKTRALDKPAEATVKTAGVHARFIYFLQNSDHAAEGVPANSKVATYTIRYDDGTEASLEIHDQIEIHTWWTNQWYNNSGAKAWPIFMGRNAISMKYNQYIGVWATQWENPNPGKAITSLSFKSEQLCVPVILAVTMTDEDYFNSPHARDDFKRPDGVPSGYFDDKLRFQQRQLLAELRPRHLAEGARHIEVIRPDCISVTFDSLLSGGAGPGEAPAAALQTPDHFSLQSDQDPDFHSSVAPARVGRQSDLYDIVDIGRFDATQLYWHTYYLALPKPLHDGSHYKLTIQGLPEGAVNTLEFDYSPATTIVPSIKVNQDVYSIRSTRRYAYLGWWAADLGAVDFSDMKTFKVIDEATGKDALEGPVALRKATDPITGEDVYDMDLAGLKETGKYHILVPGLGRSYPFSLGGDQSRQTYVTAMRGFIYQRCGCELSAEVTGGYPEHACHTLNYEDGRLVGGIMGKFVNGKLVVQNAPRRPGEPTREYHGGYHDAADYDMFYSHMEATSKTLTAFEQFPDLFKDKELNLPESGNGIPDVLNEAAWSLMFYADNQEADGGVPSGRGNDEDYSRDEWKQDGAKLFGFLPPYGTFPPSCASSSVFAAVAAQYSRILKPFNPDKADAMLLKARSAYDWAKAHTTSDWDRNGISYGRVPYRRALAWAAAELFTTTGDSKYNDDFIAGFSDPKTWESDWKDADEMPLYWWPYAACPRPGVDASIQAKLVSEITKSADSIVRSVDLFPYRMGRNRPDGGWGNGVGGGYYGNTCLRAYLLTHDQKYLDAASLCADYQLGANPLSRSFITGIGSKPPIHPELRAPLYNAQDIPAPGIPVFGPGGHDDEMGGYPRTRPLWRVYCDVRAAHEINSEFGPQNIADAAMLHMILWGLQQH
jgi:endoglucanase